MNKLALWLFSVLLVLLVSAGVCIWVATAPARTAELILKDFSNMTPGKTTAEEALRLTTKYRRAFAGPPSCVEGRCTYYFQTNNWLWWKLGLGSAAHFAGDFMIADGKLLSIRLYLDLGRKKGDRSLWDRTAIAPTNPPYTVRPVNVSTLIFINTYSPEDIRKWAYASMNVGVLKHVGEVNPCELQRGH